MTAIAEALAPFGDWGSAVHLLRALGRGRRLEAPELVAETSALAAALCRAGSSLVEGLARLAHASEPAPGETPLAEDDAASEGVGAVAPAAAVEGGS